MLDLAPAGCILAPITHEADLELIEDAITGFGGVTTKNYYVGYKIDASIYQEECGYVHTDGCIDGTSGWENYDGSDFPILDQTTYWNDPVFNNDGQIYGGVRGNKLNDLPIAGTYQFIEGAVFKCCLDLLACPFDGAL